MSRACLPAAAISLAVLLAAATPAPAAPATAAADGAGLPLNPLALFVPKPPQAVAASDGRRYLVFEVEALNMRFHELPIASIAVFVEGSARPLVEHRGAAVAAHLTPLASRISPIDRLAPSMAATAWIDLALAAGAPLPAALEVRIAADPATVPGAAGVSRVRVPVDATAPRRLGPPLAGARWAVFEACCDDANHHRRGQRSVDGRLVLPERFAIDFIRLDQKGEYHRGEEGRNENHFAWGQPVLAVADATVVDALDRYPDIAPRSPLPEPTLPAAGGNHVILDLGGGVWAMYGHLKSGSVRVRAGERVRRGQHLADVGNNGNSDLPHLHFQLMDGPDFAYSQGLPFTFERYALSGGIVPDSPEVRFLPKPEPHANDLPLNGSVVDFPPLAR